MKKLLLVLVLFISTKAFSADAIVYYCTMDIWVQTFEIKKLERWSVKDEKFTFQITKDESGDKATLKFGEDAYNYFEKWPIKGSVVNGQFFGSDWVQSVSITPEGEFIYTKNVSPSSTLITATCSEF